MAYAARVVLDSLSANGVRLVTVEATYPRFVHAQMLTHRVFSRNASSNRALPLQSVVARVIEDPALPVWWGKRAKTMEAPEEVAPEVKDRAIQIWLEAMWDATVHARKLNDLGVHKQVTNRLLEPFQFITTIFTATEWSNFRTLRCHPKAQPEEKLIAEMMMGAIEASAPVERDWHLPYITDAELDTQTLDRLIPYAVARCARVSYLQHDGTVDPERDLELYRRLTSEEPAHASPLEHVALQGGNGGRYYNLSDWMSWRYQVEQWDVTADNNDLLKRRIA